MSFDYDKIKDQQENGSYWATYSDLFMMLSMVFLFLYVVASLRTGTSNLQNQGAYQEIVRERDDLRQQIKVYSTLRDNYLETGASQDEQKMYQELMDKLVLLKEEAKSEKEDLRKQADENAKKEMALNKYQQMIRNIINTNLVSTARIKRRDVTIEKNYEEIDAQKEEIDELEQTVTKKQQQIKKGEQQIAGLNKDLQKKMKELESSFKKNKITKQKMLERVKQLKAQNQKQVDSLKQANAQAAQEIKKNQKIIEQAQQELEESQRVIASQQSNIEQLNQEKQQITQKISSMRKDFQSQMEKEQQAFEQQMAQERLNAQQRQKKQAEFLAQAKEKEQQLASEIQNMESQVQNMQGKLEKTQQEKQALAEKSQQLSNQAKNLAGEKEKLSSDLQRMKELANAKNKLISEMKQNLKNAGLKAEVDGKTGDVVIQFGEEYFDTGSANLKPGMEVILKKLMPAYSKTLFSDSKTAQKIKSVEIIGYASPTYKGKYVNPVSLSADNKEAVNYNLDLSYYRARSIFDYIFDTNKIQYSNQKKLLPMVKVTGRSFLTEGEDQREVSSMSHKEYCKKHDCKKSQRVVIKFNMDH